MWIKRNKFNAKKVVNNGYSCASKLESAVLDILKLREFAGEIRNLRTQTKVYLTNARIMYIADFSYEVVETGETEYAEAKGFKTAVWAIKKRLFENYGPGKLLIYEGSYKNPELAEVIIPKGAGNELQNGS